MGESRLATINPSARIAANSFRAKVVSD